MPDKDTLARVRKDKAEGKSPSTQAGEFVREEIEHILDASNLREQFAIIISAEDVVNCKPNPECFINGFRMIDSYRIKRGHSPMVHRDCLVIEDTAAGIRAAKAAGLQALGVTNTVSAEVLREAGADSVTKNLDDWMPETARRVFV